MADNCSIPYEGARSIRNATVNHPDVDTAIAAQKEASAVGIREHASRMRHKVKSKDMKKTVTEECNSSEGPLKVKSHSTTKRKEH